MQMRRLFSFFTLFFMYPLTGTDLPTCYSIQLQSAKGLHTNSGHTAQECQEMQIDTYVAKRCGCYESLEKAKQDLLRYQQTYPNAILVRTYTYRFQKRPSQTQTLSYKLKANTTTVNTTPLVDDDWSITNKFVDQNFSFDTNSLLQSNYLQERFHTKIQNNQKEIQNTFGNSFNLYGLSLQGKYEQYLNQDYRFREYTDYEYDLKLEFDLFKDGYFEHKKANSIAQKQEKIEYLQTFSYVLKNHYDEQLLIANAALQATNIKYYKALTALYKEALKHRKNSYINALSTQDELEVLQQQYNRYNKTSKIYAQHKRLFLPKEAALLLSKIERLHLQNSETILNLSQTNNPDRALQKARVSLLNEMPSYSDNVELGLYAHRRVVDEMGWYNTVGIEGKLPLDFTSAEEKKVAKLEQHSHLLAQKSFENIVQNKLIQLIQNFSDLQQLIAIDRDEIHFLHKRIERYKTIENNAIPNLNYNPEDKIINLSAQLIDLKYQIALKKIELFKTLGNIAYLSNTPDISLLIKGHQ